MPVWLEKIVVISKMNYSEWASPCVYVKKKDKKIRVCADFSPGVIYCLPHPELAQLSGRKYFFKVDLSSYLQITLNDECSKILAINHRLPFGIKVAPGIFQQAMDMMLRDLHFSIAYLDDILTKCETRKQHLKFIHEMFFKNQ